MFNGRLKMFLLAAAAAIAIPAAAQAQWWQHHPKYLHAMSDLRTAYWLINHREQADPMARPEEEHALKEIARAYQDLKDASRRHHARDLLIEARSDIQGEEDDPAARGFRYGALRDINKAIHATDEAINSWMF
jgi:hypothetical protein